MFKQEIWFSEHEYRAMTPKIASNCFAWFKENIPKELDLLQTDMLKDPIANKITLDFSPESLVPLYEWVLAKRRYVKLSKKQVLEDNIGAPDFILQELMEKRYAPTVRSIDIAAKMAIYLGEVFVYNDSDLYWDYVKKPKTEVSYNMPVIMGFSPPDMKNEVYFNTLSACTPVYSASIKGEADKKSWYDWYQHWMDMKEMYYSPDYSPEKYKKIWYDSLFGPNKSNGEAERSPRVILQKMREMQ